MLCDFSKRAMYDLFFVKLSLYPTVDRLFLILYFLTFFFPQVFVPTFTFLINLALSVYFGKKIKKFGIM